MKHAVKHIHFVGIGGAGMSGIAEILHNLGYRVSGSDAAESPVTQRLASLGVRVFIGHAAGQIEGAQAVVTSTAVRPASAMAAWNFSSVRSTSGPAMACRSLRVSVQRSDRPSPRSISSGAASRSLRATLARSAKARRRCRTEGESCRLPNA